MNNSQRGSAIPALLLVMLWLLFVVGWVMNIFEIVSISSDPITGMFIFRCIGIFIAPLGAVLGYL